MKVVILYPLPFFRPNKHIKWNKQSRHMFLYYRHSCCKELCHEAQREFLTSSESSHSECACDFLKEKRHLQLSILMPLRLATKLFQES
jgi:hypothetical protein